MQTEPPPRANFCETVNQWVIYDSYVAYETAKELAEEREMKKEAKDIKVRDFMNDRNRRGRFCLFLKYNGDDCYCAADLRNNSNPK